MLNSSQIFEHCWINAILGGIESDVDEGFAGAGIPPITPYMKIQGTPLLRPRTGYVASEKPKPI